jgi:multidrug efflux system membrane fusion protein
VSPQEFTAALVDDRAIGTDLGRKFVFVIDDQGVVQYRGVETGRLIDGMRIVTSGLAHNELVVVNGLQRVRPGVTVAATHVAMDRNARAVVGAARSVVGAASAAILSATDPAHESLRIE